MKQLFAASVIEFPSKLIMANTPNVLAAFAIVFLASLSLSSAFANHNLDSLNTFDKNLHHGLQPLLREKKEAEELHLRDNSLLKLEEELSEPKPIYERELIENDEIAKPKTNDIEKEEQTEDDAFSYRSMHDLIEALILVDEVDLAERLQQLRKNTTKFSNLPKRAVASAAAAAAASSANLLGANLWDSIPLVDLDSHSCEVEALSHGHFHFSGTLVHEFSCELRKFWHYGLLVMRNFKSELTLGPLVATEVIGDGILDHFLHHIGHIFHVVIREPHHLLLLPEIIRDAVPFPSIRGAIHRLKFVFNKVWHFGTNLVRVHIRHVLAQLSSHHHFAHLRERLHHLQVFGSILPLEEIVAEPVVSTAASAATATATATATASSSSVAQDYHTSLAEVLSSFRGFYDGYFASGLHDLISAGVKSFSVSSAFSNIGSYLSRIPFFNHFNYGYGPFGQGATVAASSAASASSSVGIGSSVINPVISPVISPVIDEIVPVAPTVESSSASATAIATATVAETSPVVPVAPVVSSYIPYESISSDTAPVATAAATATATATAASPVVQNYQSVPLIQAVPTLAPAIVSNSVSESSVAVAAPEVAVPTVVESIGPVASASASAAASSAVNGVSTPAVGRVPFGLGRYKPVVSAGAPAAAAAAASASASTSTSSGGRIRIKPPQYRGFDLDIDNRFRYPYSRVLPAVVPSAGVSSAAASASASASSSSASAAASSSANSLGGLNLVLPRQQIIKALGYDYLLPGDVIAVNLKNKSTLFGRVLDATSPITFNFLRPKVRTALLRHGGRVWNLLPGDFRDPDCIRKFNNPSLLNYAF